MLWRNLRFNRKLAVIMGVLLCIILLMSGVFIFYLRDIEHETRDITFAAGLNSTILASEVGHWRWVTALEHYVFDEAKTLDIQEDPHRCAFGEWYYGPQRAMAENFYPAIAEPLRLIEEAHDALHASANMIRQHKTAGNIAEARAAFEKISMQNMQMVQELLTQVSAIMSEDIAESVQRFDNYVARTLVITIGIVIVASLLALYMGMAITRSITEPVLKIANYVQNVSRGRLDETLTMRRRDELGELADNLKSMVANITSMMREVKAQEQRTREVEERVRILLDATPVGATLWDRDYNILECNQEIVRMFDCASKSEYIDGIFRRSPEFQPDGMVSTEKRVTFFRAAFETGYQKYEWMFRLPSGGEVPAEITLVRIPWQGDWCIAAYVRDLREVKAHEQKMREAREHAQHLVDISRAAQLASQAKSEFLARMSHELRTPLNAAIGFLGLELQKDDMSQETCEHLQTSLDACYTLLSLINDILDISKIEAGRFELTNNDYRFVNLINEIVSLNSFRLNSFNREAKPIVFHLEVDENLPSRLHGDDLRIKQVLNNLLSNAFKYTEKGMVTLSAKHTPPAPGEEEQADRCLIRFCIQDTGQGIKAENLKSLFTSYTRFDSKANRLIEGTGLGLAISKNLVELMGGQMEVTSEYGEGSDFSCIIPQVVVDPTPVGHITMNNLNNFSDAPQQRGNKYRSIRQCSYLPHATVLVVDDVDTNLLVAKGVLQRYGMTVDCASSGQEAIDLVRSENPRYNAVFMDHMMPGMDGIETLHSIRAIDSDYARSVPVIILTANVVAGNEKMFREQGFQAFLGKPLEPTQLDAVINKWIKDNRQEIYLDSPKRRRNDFLQNRSSTDSEAATATSMLTCLVPGLDMQEGVLRFGSEAGYIDVLRSYAVNTPPLLEQMRHTVETDLVEYAIIAHGLKGASYGVGANALGDMAKELEFAANEKNCDKVRSDFPLFLDAAEQLLRSIDLLLHECMPEPAEEDKPLKPVPDIKELAALYQASQSCSYNAMLTHLQNLEQYRYQSDGGLVVWLRERVDALDYDLINERLAGCVDESST